jgi:hypothetical protein
LLGASLGIGMGFMGLLAFTEFDEFYSKDFPKGNP